jgi:drug/metabolite transporter (DMT)-like permease
VKTSRKWDERRCGTRAFANPEDVDKDRGRYATPSYGYLAVIIATWAANWPMMRLALDHTEPMVFVSLRMAGSIAILAPILAALSCPLLPVRRERLALFWVGQLQVTGFLVFSIIGLAIVPPGRAIVLAYTMPHGHRVLSRSWSTTGS